MRWLATLERKVGRHAGIPHLALFLAIGQGAAAALIYSRAQPASAFVFAPQLVLVDHEYWRLLTFLFYPSTTDPVFLFFELWFIWFMGAALEQVWGTFRFNIFMLVGYLASIGTALGIALLAPGAVGSTTNIYLLASIFLAFAALNPDFQILLFFILPVRVKWLALFVWFWYGVGFASGDWYTRVAIIAATLNFFLFLTPTLIDNARGVRTKAVQKRRRMATAPLPTTGAMHTCVICGRTEKTNPNLEFRYCDKCAGSRCYCEEHLRTHVHVMPTAIPPPG